MADERAPGGGAAAEGARGACCAAPPGRLPQHLNPSHASIHPYQNCKQGFEKTGLGERVATLFVKLFGKSTLGLAYGLSCELRGSGQRGCIGGTERE